MISSRRPRARFALEALESRLCLDATGPTLMQTISLPYTPGTWLGSPIMGSPIFANIDSDPQDELIVPIAGGAIAAYDSQPDGTLALLRTYQATYPSNLTSPKANFKSTPLVVTIPDPSNPGGAPIRAIFAALGMDENAASGGQHQDGRIFGWNAATGQILPGWPQASGPPTYYDPSSGVVGALASGDLDGDGTPEIIATSFSNFVTAFKSNGTVLWRFHSNDTVISGAVVGDIDRDGRPEVVYGSDSSDNGFFKFGGDLVILAADGSLKYRYHINEVAWSSPVLADLNGDGYLDIVFGAGHHYRQLGTPAQQKASTYAGNRIYAIDYQGRPLTGWPYHTTTAAQDAAGEKRSTYQSVAVADMNGDGQLEAVAEDRGGYLHVIQANGQPLPGWEGGKFIGFGGDNYAAPIVADVNGDGKPDIVAASRYLSAFDAAGNRIDLPRVGGFSTAAAVGRIDDQPGLVMASLQFSFNDGHPDSIELFRLPPSTLTPPWPMHRRSPDSVAVRYSDPFLDRYVQGVYQAALGRAPTSNELAAATTRLRQNTASLGQIAAEVVTSDAARSLLVMRLYNQILGRDPSASELTAGKTGLAGSVRLWDLARTLLSSAEAVTQGKQLGKSLGLADPAGQVVFAYRGLLKRDPNATESSSWVAAIKKDPINGYANFVKSLLRTSYEARLKQLGPFAAAAGVPFGSDSLYAASYDLNRGVRDDQVLIALLASGGNYVATSRVAAWARSAYRDIAGREATPAEIGSLFTQMDQKGLTLAAFAGTLVRSRDARAALFQSILGRAPTSAELTNLMNANKTGEDFTAAILATDEYFRRVGGTNSAWILAIYKKFAGIDPVPSTQLQAIVQQLQKGTSRRSVALTALTQSFTRDRQVIDAIFKLIPDESLGVLRTGWGKPTSGIAKNPDPALVASYSKQLQSGALKSDDLLVKLLTTPQYQQKAAYFKGFYRSQQVRY